MPQAMPPMTLYVMNVRYLMRPAPATMGAKVRTMGTKRARTIALGPYFSMKSWAFSKFSCLKSLELGRLKSFGPRNLPIMYPTWSPMTAASTIRVHTSHSGWLMYWPSATKRPAVNSSESPGRNAKSPDSAKTMSRMPGRANVSIR